MKFFSVTMSNVISLGGNYIKQIDLFKFSDGTITALLSSHLYISG